MNTEGEGGSERVCATILMTIKVRKLDPILKVSSY